MSDEGTPNDTPAGDGENTPGPVSYKRFDQVNRQRGELQRQVGELQRQVNDLEAARGNYDTLAQQLADLKASHETERGVWAREKTVMGAGITDPDGIAVANMFYERLPEEGRPDIGEWVSGFREDPSKAPKPLQPYFAEAPSPPQQHQQPPNGKTKPSGRRLPDSNNGTRSGAPSPAGKPLGGGLTRDAWKANREQAIAQVSNEFASRLGGYRRG